MLLILPFCPQKEGSLPKANYQFSGMFVSGSGYLHLAVSDPSVVEHPLNQNDSGG